MEKLQQALEKARVQRSDALAGLTAPNGLKAVRQPPAAREPMIDPSRAIALKPSLDHLRRNRIVVQVGDSSVWPISRRAAEAFRMARTRVLHALEAQERGSRVLAVTSARQGDGKTLVSVNLAVGLAKHPSLKVLLIDADLRRPAVSRVLGIQPKLGFSDYLEGRCTLEECLVDPGIDNLLIIPQVRRLTASSELLASEALERFLDDMQKRHPDWLILLDCPPLLAVDDTLVLLRHTDGCLLVVREGSTRRTELRRAAELIGEERFLGSILNFADSHRQSGYYYYYYYYGGS
jgi:capsular exopolysaccharide synthesis family protein